MRSRINLKEVYELHKKLYSNNKIAKILNKDPHTVGKAVKKLGLLPNNSARDLIQVENLDVLIGTLLGDSCLKYGKAKYPCLSFNHSSNQREYFNHKSEIFNYLSTGKNNKEYLAKTTFGEILVLSYNSKYLKSLDKIEKVFYQNRVKIIPIEFLKESFTWGSLAYLFMDDGNINKNSININLQNFTLEELNLFKKFLLQRFNLQFTIQKNGKYFRLYLRKKSLDIFIKNIKPYIIDSMLYKLPMSS